MARVRLSNDVDEGMAKRGLLPQDAVRALEVEALVDTGATMLALPEDVVARLGLHDNPASPDMPTLDLLAC